jgi:hypothetical protein
MKAVTRDHAVLLAERLRQRSGSSYMTLLSSHGFSLTEVAVLLGQAKSSYMRMTADECLLLSLFDLDTTSRQARLQLCSAGNPVPPVAFVDQLVRQNALARIVSHVFADEYVEIALLQAMGFQQEAVFREHLYTNGGHQDVIVYGRLEPSP